MNSQLIALGYAFVFAVGVFSSTSELLVLLTFFIAVCWVGLAMLEYFGILTRK